MELTEQEQQNVDNGLTTDGRPICDRDHCSCGCGAHFGCFFVEDLKPRNKENK